MKTLFLFADAELESGGGGIALGSLSRKTSKLDFSIANATLLEADKEEIKSTTVLKAVMAKLTI